MAQEGIDFTAQMRLLCAELVEFYHELQHIDLHRVAVVYAQARKRVSYGLFASLTPLRFRNGRLTDVRSGRRVRVQPVIDPTGREMLYILTFYLPRFLDLPLREKLITVLHELWHISPDFDGDLRRFPGRCYAHSSSQEAYDEEMGRLADRFLRVRDGTIPVILQAGFDELSGRYGAVWGSRVRRPRIIECRSESTNRRGRKR